MPRWKSRTFTATTRWASRCCPPSATTPIATPTLVGTLSICIVFFPVVLLTGVARFLFTPLALAVVYAMLTSYLLSRTLVPTMARYLLPVTHDAGPASRGWQRLREG